MVARSGASGGGGGFESAGGGAGFSEGSMSAAARGSGMVGDVVEKRVPVMGRPDTGTRRRREFVWSCGKTGGRCWGEVDGRRLRG